MRLTPLSELYTERRYYREFHQKIFTLFNTIYLSAIIGQTIATAQLANTSNCLIYILLIILGGILPIYNTYIYLRYHLVIEGLNRTIITTLIHIQNNEALKASNISIEWHMGNSRKVEWTAIFKGQGHWYFITTMWLLVIINTMLLIQHL